MRRAQTMRRRESVLARLGRGRVGARAVPARGAFFAWPARQKALAGQDAEEAVREAAEGSAVAQQGIYGQSQPG